MKIFEMILYGFAFSVFAFAIGTLATYGTIFYPLGVVGFALFILVWYLFVEWRYDTH